MHKQFGRSKLWKSIFIIFVSSILLITIVHLSFLKFPLTTNKIDANLLVVEGWLPDQTLEKVKNEFQQECYNKLIITGMNLPENYYQESMNGYLIFYPRIKTTEVQSDNIHTIEVNAFSELDRNGRAHFNFYVNKNLISEFQADKQKRKYGIKWKGKLEDIDSVMIQFDGDGVGPWGDRNLYIKEIIIDHKIVIPYQYNSVYDIGALDGKDRIFNDFNSNAERTRIDLIRMGVDSSRIVAVPGKVSFTNRTLKITIAFRNWLKESKITVKGINLISSGPHARRKLMIYNKIIGKDYKLGIIYYPDLNKQVFVKNILMELREFFGIVYYWIILRFYF